MSTPTTAHKADTPDIESVVKFRDRFGVWLSYAGSAYYDDYRTALKPLGVTPSWVTALAIIEQEPGITQSELGRRMAINRASAMAVAAGLENAQLVSRTSGTGRNQMLLALTAQGRSALVTACSIEDELSARWLAPFSAQERELLVSLLKRLMDEMQSRP